MLSQVEAGLLGRAHPCDLLTVCAPLVRSLFSMVCASFQPDTCSLLTPDIPWHRNKTSQQRTAIEPALMTSNLGLSP